MIVLTMYVALLTRVDVSSEDNQSQRIFAGILVCAHLAMILTVTFEAIVLVFSIRQRDSPLPRSQIITVLPVDDFSSQRISVKRRLRHAVPRVGFERELVQRS